MSDIIQSTTQQFLDIYDITNNFVLMKDGTVSTIITVDAMNFGLLAEEEQDAIMYAYAGLLNSLNYTIQIIIHSQTKDVTTYLKLLQEQEGVTETETMRRRIRMYREFVGNLIHERNVLDKKFYVVIPASALEMGLLSSKSILPGQSSAFDISSIERSVLIEKAKNLLDPKRDHMIAQFGRIGLFSRQLTTQEIIQLFYIRYNPEAAEGQQIGESNTYTSPLVKASIQGNLMNTVSAATPQPPVVSTPVSTSQEPAVPDLSSIQGAPLSDAVPAETQVAPLEEIHIEPTVTTPPLVPPAQALATEDAPPVPVSTLPLAAAPLPPTPQIPEQKPAPVVVAPPHPEIIEEPPTVEPPPVNSVTPPITLPGDSVPSAVSSTPPNLGTSTSSTPFTADPSSPAVPASSLNGTPPSEEAALQSDLNNALQAIGGSVPGTPATPGTTSTPSNPTASSTSNTPTNPGSSSTPNANLAGGDLPPLPEI